MFYYSWKIINIQKSVSKSYLCSYCNILFSFGMILSALGLSSHRFDLGFYPKELHTIGEWIITYESSPFTFSRWFEDAQLTLSYLIPSCQPMGSNNMILNGSMSSSTTRLIGFQVLIPFVTSLLLGVILSSLDLCFDLSFYRFVYGFYPKRPHTIRR